MKLISIFYNGIEIDYVQETLKLNDDFSILPDTLKFISNEYPFLIIENLKTIEAFGASNISMSSNQYYEVDIVTLDSSVKGELQILESLSEYRKCNIRFSSKLFQFSKMKIKELFPIASVTYGNIIPYDAKYEGMPPNPVWYRYFVDNHRDGEFPHTLWKAPMISYPFKYGRDLEADDKWYHYAKYLNARNTEGEYLLNRAIDKEEGVTIENLNVPTWNIYLLTPLYLLCEKAGLTFPNKLLENEFAKSIAFISKENNLTEVTETDDKTNVSDIFKQIWKFSSIPGGPQFYQEYSFLPPGPGKYILTYKFTSNDDYAQLHINNGFQVGGIITWKKFYGSEYTFEGTYEFDYTQKSFNDKFPLRFMYYSANRRDPHTIDQMSVSSKIGKPGYMFHPTIEFGRYIPDWTVGDYLNQLRILFNIQFIESNSNTILDIEYNDIKINTLEFVDLGKNYIADFSKISETDILFKYDNDVDKYIVINEYNIEENKLYQDDKTKLIENKFKLTPLTFTPEYEDKGGIGLILIKGNEAVEVVDNKRLTLEDIYKNYYTNTVNNYLNTNRLKLELSVTKYILLEIQRKKKVLVNNLPFYVLSVSYKSDSDLIDIDLDLLPLK
ncbi:hypothetical protein HX071_08530 [Myroides marinus]|uniref:hypothetical protein n=1 Tax=Myroides marinus TaxID=703342 RepID=UPI002576461E|nr:hypothetical protein [Myroides marinus]MDM1502249.1 hypothetical protein [Myroides marinus]